MCDLVLLPDFARLGDSLVVPIHFNKMKNILFVLFVFSMLSCQHEPINFKVDTIDESGIIGVHLSKIENGANPILIILPGSGKALLDKEEISGIVADGYDVLSLAYYGKKHLPKRISKVPVEYVNKAVKWTRSKMDPGRKIVLTGISKGAELALLYASLYDNIDGLICYSPSILVLPDHVGIPDKTPLISSWTYQNKEVAFAAIRRFDDKAGKVLYKKYLEPLLDSLPEHPRGKINADQINCPTLLLSGKSDMVWPAYEMSELITRELKNKSPRRQIESIGYDDAGHQFFWFAEGQPERVTTSQSVRLSGIKKHRFIYGGTEEGTKKAMLKSRKAVIDFLENIK